MKAGASRRHAPRMKTLITGIAGFAGSHLAELALAEGAEVAGTLLPGAPMDGVARMSGRVTTHPCDLTEPGAVARVLAEIRPDRVFHLAGASVVGTSWARRAEVLRADPDEKKREHHHRHFSYADRSRYAEQLERLRAAFDPEQVLVVESERLFDEPAATMERVFAHLSLDPVPMSSYETFKGQSASEVPAEAAAAIRAAVGDDVARLTELLDEPPSWAD